MKLSATSAAKAVNNNLKRIDAEIATLDGKLKALEQEATRLAAIQEIPLQRLAGVMDDHDLFQRARQRYVDIRAQLFPGA